MSVNNFDVIQGNDDVVTVVDYRMNIFMGSFLDI